MNRLTSLIGFFIIAMLMTGCIAIPTGDGGKIKLSKDGGKVEDKEGEKSTITMDRIRADTPLKAMEILQRQALMQQFPRIFRKIFYCQRMEHSY
ncbi:hypothetical protein MKY34_12495 [Sporosarcina sp. FSL K6-1522]|uniref:hypothetical protein n=1 Tax=Sporosarcina sp. FSL K6-1522 TaxID=2921554 RepID=UPI00315A0884